MLQEENNIHNGETLKQAGIDLATESADKKIPKWTTRAFELCLEYLTSHPNGYMFMGENARIYCEAHGLPEPPSKRAYGGIIQKLKKAGRITFAGYGKVTNPQAHRANATIWKVIGNPSKELPTSQTRLEI